MSRTYAGDPYGGRIEEFLNSMPLTAQNPARTRLIYQNSPGIEQQFQQRPDIAENFLPLGEKNKGIMEFLHPRGEHELNDLYYRQSFKETPQVRLNMHRTIHGLPLPPVPQIPTSTEMPSNVGSSIAPREILQNILQYLMNGNQQSSPMNTLPSKYQRMRARI